MQDFTVVKAVLLCDRRTVIIGRAHYRENYPEVKLSLVAVSHLHPCNSSMFFYPCLDIKSTVTNEGATRLHISKKRWLCFTDQGNVQSKASTVRLSRLNKLQCVDNVPSVLSVYSAGMSSAVKKKSPWI